MRLVFLLAMVLEACTTPVKSEDYPTAQMDANYDAACDGTSTVLTGVFTEDGTTLATYVTLSDGDAVSASSGSNSVPLAELDVGELISYVGGLPIIEQDTPFVFTLTRTVDDGAPDSEVTLPPPFELGPVSPAQSYSFGTNTLSLSWSGNTADDPMSLDISGDCIEEYTEVLDPDPGHIEIAPGTFVGVNGRSGASCSLTATLTRTREGTLDAGFAGGSVDARQQRSASFGAAP